MGRAETGRNIDFENEELAGRNVNELTRKEIAEEHSKRTLSLEAERIRKDLLKRMNREQGVLSSDEKDFWERRLDESRQNEDELRSIKEEFETHWRRSLEMRRLFYERMEKAEKEGMLKSREERILEESFSRSGLEDKEKLLKEFGNELHERYREIQQRFKEVKDEIQEKRKRSLERAINYDEKIKIIDIAEVENVNLKNYMAEWQPYENKQIGKNTIQEYYEWFLSLSEQEQLRAIAKAVKEDIEPRVKLWEIYEQLPSRYKKEEPHFLHLGKRERERFFRDLELKIDKNYRDTLRKEGLEVFSQSTYAFCLNCFEAEEKDLGKRLLKKIEFLETLPKHIQAEEKLWDKFEKLPPKIQQILEKEFSELDFGKKTQLLSTKAPKMAEKYTKMLQRMNNLNEDKQIIKIYEDDFEEASTLDEMEKILNTAEAFNKSKKNYFKAWNANKKYFNSSLEVYEKWYEKEIKNLEDARDAEYELGEMIVERKEVYEGIQKLPKFLKERIDMDTSFEEREEQYEKYRKIAEHYKSTIPLFIRKAQAAEKKGEVDDAFDFYMAALKLDPENEEFETLAAALRQKNGADLTASPESAEDEKATNEILGKIESREEISEKAEELAREKILLNLTKKHREHTGATAGTLKARAKETIKNLEDEEKAVAEEIVESGKFTVDTKGNIREVRKIKVGGEQTEETQNEIYEDFDKKLHKSEAASTGMDNVKFVSASSGQEMELHTAAQRQLDDIQKMEKQIAKIFESELEKSGYDAKERKAILENYQNARRKTLVEEKMTEL